MVRPLLAVALLGALVGCASYTDQTREVRSLYRSERYHEAFERLEKSDLKEQTRNRLLYRLEKAMLLDRMGERDRSRKLLIEADKIADELYTVSASKTVASFLYNDSATDYEGEDYEKVAIHTQLALSFLEDQDYTAARVEAVKINNKLAEINQGYEDNKNKYGEDAFARYLAGIIYEKRKEWDDAIIDYTKALALYDGGYKDFVRGGYPDGLVKALYRLLVKRGRTDRLAALKKDYPKLAKEAQAELDAEPNAGEIVVIHEAGQIATKSTGEFFFTVGSQVVRFSFPTIRRRGAYVGKTGLEIKGGKFAGYRYFAADNVQDMNEIAYQTLEDKRLRVIAKQTARLLAKGQLAEQARQNFGPWGELAANIYNVVTETADTRSWTLLPEAYYVTRVRLAPGKYELKLVTDARIGDVRTVEVAPNEMQIFREAR